MDIANRVSAQTALATLSYLDRHSETPINFPSTPGGKPERNTGDSDQRVLRIANARTVDPPPMLDVYGFQLASHRSRVDDFFDRAEIDAVYSKEIRMLLASLLAARKIVVFDYTLRSDSERLRRLHGLRDPSPKVHVDHTPRSAIKRLAETVGADAAAWLERGFGVVNVWRSVGGLAQTTPLALCDGRSVDDRDLIPVERRAAERVGEIYQLAYSATHRWYFYPDLSPDEVLLIKTFDSRDDPSVTRFAPHCAFANVSAPEDAAPRQSIEARAFVLY